MYEIDVVVRSKNSQCNVPNGLPKGLPIPKSISVIVIGLLHKNMVLHHSIIQLVINKMLMNQ